MIRKVYNDLPPWAKGLVAVGVVAGTGYALFKISKLLTGEKQREIKESTAVGSELQSAQAQTGLSYPGSQYLSFANVIETAGFDIGTDEEAIYSIFRKLNNDADYLQLLQAWGKPNRKIYDWGIGYDMTLQQYLRYEMGEDEIAQINFILKSKGIKYRI